MGRKANHNRQTNLPSDRELQQDADQQASAANKEADRLERLADAAMKRGDAKGAQLLREKAARKRS